MNQIWIFCAVLFHIPIFLVAQNLETINFQEDKIDSTSNYELQIFYKKFNIYIDSLEVNSMTSSQPKGRMINN
ncbi:MAG: hypothetical protein ABIO60_05345, partial [Aquaticitalea sp.]